MRRRGIGRRSALRASGSRQVLGRIAGARGLALACAATGRLDQAEREALRGERLPRLPQPTRTATRLSQVRVARSPLERGATGFQRAQGAIRGVSDPGRLTAIAARFRAGPPHRESERWRRPPRRGARRARASRAAVPRDRSLPTRDRRAAPNLAERRQERHPRACAASWTHRERIRSLAQKRSACSSSPNHPGDPWSVGPKP